ncbi:hypothetical protein [Actinoplanes siamensis]|nr:hypothetical protein [Actinoplanes siamensis]
MPLPTVGRIVHYTLTQHDADAIQARRAEAVTTANMTGEGQTLPAVVVRTFGGDAANLQVLLDGPDTYWATSRTEGEGPGHWAWPPRA